ncbi:MAG TPA: barstar family protein [Anaerolineales bacterium]|nr:barstar family protein [Anaerolineales bacterium]
MDAAPRVDLTEYLPGLAGGQMHVANLPYETLTETLRKLGFTVYTISGNLVLDEHAFFDHAVTVFGFPASIQRTWEAWDEYLLQFFRTQAAARVAVVWKEADLSFNLDARTFLLAVEDLHDTAYNVERGLLKGAPPCQVELFILGIGSGFRRPAVG